MSSSLPLPPLTFRPHHKVRVWGGRNLESYYQRSLPDEQRYGEAWELVDRPPSDEQSIVTTPGDYLGMSLQELWSQHRSQVFGVAFKEHSSKRFPLLIKILDACQDLSLQVHPPEQVANQLGGEPKTEFWYVAHAQPGAKLYVGLKNTISPEDFRAAAAQGIVNEHIHVITPKAGQGIFIPSGRLHAIGAGLLIHEIQQNSDTTYRVFDWNRMGLDGMPRELHLDESILSIDFSDIQPTLIPSSHSEKEALLCSCPFFQITRKKLQQGEGLTNPDPDCFALHTIVEGSLHHDNHQYVKGETILLPPKGISPQTRGATTILTTIIPH